MSEALRRIDAACIDGRSRTPRYIQTQLRKLHDVLVQNANDIKESLRRDSKGTTAEISAEFFLTLSCVKRDYEQIDVEQMILDEYSLARSTDSIGKRVPAGVVFIEAYDHTPLYSIIAPLSAAIAAGNCVIVELKKTTSELNALLRRLLGELDQDTVVVVDAKPKLEDVLSHPAIKVEYADGVQEPSLYSLVSLKRSRTIAVVDRSANILDAARAVVRARFAFKGRSPYGPDLVLVNEFRLKDFCNAVMQEVTKRFGDHVGEKVNGNGSIHYKAGRESQEFTKLAREEDSSTELISGSGGSIFQVETRSSQLLQQKINEPLLLIHAVSSLDDTIDFSNAGKENLLAVYLFAQPSTAKYLSQFIEADVSFMNDIPTDLLIGPPAPRGFATSPNSRYTPDMFSIPRPEFATTSVSAKDVQAILDTSDKEATANVWKEVQSLSPSTQPPGKAIGFFEQGIIWGAIGVFGTALTAVGLTGYYVIPKIYKSLR